MGTSGSTEYDFRDFAHIGPGTLAGQYLRRFWQPVLLRDDLVAGVPRRLEIFGEYFTAYRGEDGTPHVIQDRCPHRSTQLSLGWVEGDCIRCFYHGWMFDGEGNCVDQPAEKEAFKDAVHIRAYPTREYLGLIFAYLGDDEVPEFPLFPEVDLEKDAVFYRGHPVPCNYFQRIENDLDELHIHFVHRVSTDAIGLDEIPEIHVEETEYGILRQGTRNESGLNVNRTGHIIMPNILMVITPGRPSRPEWQLHIAWRVPVNDENMMTFVVTARKDQGGGLQTRPHVQPDPMYFTEEILAGRMRVQDIDPDYPGLFNVQDNVALAGQGAIVDRSKERLGQSDKGIYLIRKIWSREMEALATGKPLKVWKRPPSTLIDETSAEARLAAS